MKKWLIKKLKKLTMWLEEYEGETTQLSEEEEQEIEDVLDDEPEFKFHMKEDPGVGMDCSTPGCDGKLKKTGRKEPKSAKNIYKCNMCGVSYTLEEQATQTVESPGKEKIKKEDKVLFCEEPRPCEHLSLTEKEQQRDKTRGHHCKEHKKKLFHGRHHPKLPRLPECMDNNSYRKRKDDMDEELCQFCPITDYGDREPPTPNEFNLGCEGIECDTAYQNYIDEGEKH